MFDSETKEQLFILNSESICRLDGHFLFGFWGMLEKEMGLPILLANTNTYKWKRKRNSQIGFEMAFQSISTKISEEMPQPKLIESKSNDSRKSFWKAIESLRPRTQTETSTSTM